MHTSKHNHNNNQHKTGLCFQPNRGKGQEFPGKGSERYDTGQDMCMLCVVRCALCVWCKSVSFALYHQTLSRVDSTLHFRLHFHVSRFLIRFMFIRFMPVGTNVIGAESLEDMVAKLKKPRRVMMMVKAGAAVDAFIEKLVRMVWLRMVMHCVRVLCVCVVWTFWIERTSYHLCLSLFSCYFLFI